MRSWCVAKVLLAAVAFSAWCQPARAASWTSSLSGTSQPQFQIDGALGNWNAIYSQGFTAGINASSDPGLSTGVPVVLKQFTFYRSGRVTLTDDAGSGALPTPTNVQLAIVNFNGFQFNNFGTNNPNGGFNASSPYLLGLSTNTIASIPVSALSTGTPIAFNFNSVPLTYGVSTDIYVNGNVSNTYDAVFVTSGLPGGTTIGSGVPLTIVKVPAIIATSNGLTPPDEHPVHDYGSNQIDYFNAVSNFENGTAPGDIYLSAFNLPYGYADADFVANFSTPILHGDFNNDGHFNTGDIPVMLSALTNLPGFETTNGYSPTDMVTLGDFTSDSRFTNADIQGMLEALRAGQGNVAAVPEPTAVLLAGFAGAALVMLSRGHKRRNNSGR